MIRVYELAREFNIKNKALLDILAEMKISVSSPMSSVSAETATKIREELNNKNKTLPDKLTEMKNSISTHMSSLSDETVTKIREIGEKFYNKKNMKPDNKTVNSDITENLEEQNYKIFPDGVGYTYEKIFGKYLKNVKIIKIEEPHTQKSYQIHNFVRFCELIVKVGDAKQINLLTKCDNGEQKDDANKIFLELAKSLKKYNIDFVYKFSDTMHDRQIDLDNGWIIQIGRGLDIYKIPPQGWYSIGSNDLKLRPCKETRVNIFRNKNK